MGMVVLRNDSLGDEIQLRKGVFQFAETDFIRDSTSVITLLEGTILTSTFYFIPQSKLNILDHLHEVTAMIVDEFFSRTCWI